MVRVATLNPQCAFISGTVRLPRFFHTVFLSVVLLALMVVMFLMNSAIGWLVIAKFFVIAFLQSRAFPWIRGNKPSCFDLRELPPGLLL